MPFFRVGENVPEVTSPSITSGVSADPHAGPRDGAAGGDDAAQDPLGARLLLREQHVAAPERRLPPADRPAEPGLVGGDVERDVLAVQRVAHLGAQRVAGAEAAGQHAELLAGGQQRVPERARRRRWRRSARSRARRCSRCGRRPRPGRRGARPGPGPRRTTCSRGRPAARPPRAPRRTWCPGRRARRSRGAGRVTVTPSGALSASRRDDLGGVGGVGDQQHPVVGVQVGDQVVDDAAGRVVAAQRVLRLAVPDPAEVVGQRAR